MFVGRNFSRLDKELNLYKYEPLKIQISILLEGMKIFILDII